MRLILGVVCVLAWGLSGCAGTQADVPIKRKRDPRATADDPNVEAVKPPAPPGDETPGLSDADLQGMAPAERDAIMKMRAKEAAAKKANIQ